MNWYDDTEVTIDEEHKITEFDYEKYLHPQLFKGIDTEEKDFKHLIKVLNIFTNTEFE